MTQDDFDNKCREILKKIKDIDNLTASILGSNFKLFGEVSLPLIGATVNEAAFSKLISFFYVIYFESGKASLDFLMKEYLSVFINLKIYEDDPRKTIHNLRTLFQHNLDINDEEDRKKIENCRMWFNSVIEMDYPGSSNEWSHPLELIISVQYGFLVDIEESVKYIESTEEKDYIADVWKGKAFNVRSVYSFEKICTAITPYFGLEDLNTNDFCKRRIQQWIKDLNILDYGYDFEKEAAKLIERDLIKFVNEESQRLPITGNDIMIAIGLSKPGKIIGELLRKSKLYYEENPCSPEDLLNYVVQLHKGV